MSRLQLSTRALLLLTGLALLSPVATAQSESDAPAKKKKIVAFGGDSDRRAATVFLFDQEARKMLGFANINYGTPTWKPELDEMLKQNKPFKQRFGANAWTTLETSLALNIGGTAIRPGQYGLGIGRGADGFYVFAINGNMIRRQNMGPWDVAKVQPRIKIPLQHKADADMQKKLNISLEMSKQDPTKGQFIIAWGSHRLTAAVVAEAAKPRARGKRRQGRNKKK